MIVMLSYVVSLSGVVWVVLCMRKRGRQNMVQQLPCMIIWVKGSRWEGKKCSQEGREQFQAASCYLIRCTKKQKVSLFLFCHRFGVLVMQWTHRLVSFPTPTTAHPLQEACLSSSHFCCDPNNPFLLLLPESKSPFSYSAKTFTQKLFSVATWGHCRAQEAQGASQASVWSVTEGSALGVVRKSKRCRKNPSLGDYNHLTGGDQTNIYEKENSNARIAQWNFLDCECPGQRDEQGSHKDRGDQRKLHWKMGLNLGLEGFIGFIHMVRKEKKQATRTGAGLREVKRIVLTASTSLHTAPLLLVLATLSHLHFLERRLMAPSTRDPSLWNQRWCKSKSGL